MIITTAQTIQDGQVLRWYTSEHVARYSDAVASASRNAIEVEGDLTEIEPLIPDLKRAHERLKRGEDVTDMATHRRMGPGRLVKPIIRPTGVDIEPA